MTKIPWFPTAFALLGFFTVAHEIAAQTPRERISLNEDWRFQKDDPAGTGDSLSYGKIRDWLLPTGNAFTAADQAKSRPAGDGPGKDVSYAQPSFDDGKWRELNLPHDWGIEGPFTQEYPGETGKLPWWGVGWYRKSFEVGAMEKSQQFTLEIDGAMSFSAVWLNGTLVGGWPYGYSSWQLDLTPHVKQGANVLAIRLDNPGDSSRWYPGGGIYRNVWLLKTGAVRFAPWGTQVTTPEISTAAANVDVATRLENPANAAINLGASIYEIDANGKQAARPVVAARFPAGARQTQLRVPDPKVWSPETPNLYRVVTYAMAGDKVIDKEETDFGIRKIEFTADRGFLLNGKRVPIQGVCMHHDLGALGGAFNTRAAQRQIGILKEMGVNAIRISHNPPAPEFLDLCDRMGILVMDELCDAWKRGKVKNGYQNLFDDWSEKDLRAMVRRDRNHPSVILWSLGNEILEQSAGEGPAMQKRLAGFVREEDTTRQITMGVSDGGAGYNEFQKGLDVFGYNYKPWEYRKFINANRDKPLLGSETSSLISSRGEYFFPVSSNRDEGKSDFQMSSYDLFAPRWAAPTEQEFKGQDENPTVMGEFVWTGFDYLGEPTPYNSDSTNLLNYHTPEAKAAAEKELKELGKIKVPSRSSYFGIVDLAGFKKDRFYLYQSRWKPDLPMAHILPHWNWSERVGEVTPVHVYTSGDEAELFLNGKSQGRRKKGEFEYRLRWDDVKYEPGELKVVTYKANRTWATETIRTTGAAAKLTLKPDRTEIAADGYDLSFLTLTIADKDGAPVPRSKNPVKFTLTGPGEIVATDNGDPTDHTLFQSPDRKAFNGLALVIVRGKPGAAGEIVVSASSEGLAPATARLKTSR